MPRYKITIEYDGTDYVGWQRQDNGPSIQQSLEEAARKLCQQEVVVHGAGRTDSGVHALGQVAHLDLPKDYPADKVRDALNALTRPQPIAVLSAELVDEDFHARFSAVGRAYLYRILNRRPPPGLETGKVWHHPAPLNASTMHEAAQVLIGEHDFTSFRATECQADNPVKTLDRLDVSQVGEEIHLVVEARSFLHHQVRNFAGTLAWVGTGKWTKAHVREALQAKKRAAAGPTAPPEGLYLTRVEY